MAAGDDDGVEERKGYPYEAEPLVPLPELSLEELLRDPEVGQHAGRSILAVRRIVAALLKRPQSPAVYSALSLIKESADVANILALHAAIGDIKESSYGRVVADARLLLARGAEPPIGRTVIGNDEHQRAVLRVLRDLHPVFRDERARGGARARFVARRAALWIEVFVGRRPEIAITGEALAVFGAGRGRPAPGTRPPAP